MRSTNQDMNMFNELKDESLDSVWGAKIADGRQERNLVKKVKDLYKQDINILDALSQEDKDCWQAYRQKQAKSSKPWFDQIQDMISNQASGITYEKYKSIP